MTNHYYNSNLETKTNKKLFKYKLLTQQLSFYTDHGVFSKSTIDYGTRVLLKNIKINDAKKRLLDVGCGYGPIGISLAKEFPHLSVDMIDVNQRAISLAKENIELNDLKNVSAYESHLFDNVAQKFDYIVTNPPIRAGKEVVHEIFVKSWEYLNDDGEIYVVIQKKQGAPSAKDKLESVFGNCKIISKDKGYYILKSNKEKK